MQKHLNEKASHLIEALPYIREFFGKTFVIKCGGAAMTDLSEIHHLIKDIALLYFCGIRVILIHGGGSDITELCEKLNMPVKFSHGQRVTNAETMEVVQMVLLGKSNRNLVNLLNQEGVKAVGLSGQDSAFLKAEKFDSHLHASAEKTDLGFVGDVTEINTELLDNLLNANFLPIIAPIGVDQQGQSYNINADIVAGAIAGKLKAEKLIVLSDVNGLYENPKDPETLISIVKKESIREWLSNGKITGGMIPKLQACLRALDKGVSCSHLLNGKMPHSLLLEVFTDLGVGTMIS